MAKVLGAEAKLVAASLNKFIRSDDYTKTLGAHIKERREDLYRQILASTDDKEMWKLQGQAQALQELDDWVEGVFKIAEKDLKKEIKKDKTK